MQPVETAFGEMTGEAMLISATRATTLKLANQREAAAPRQPVLMRGADPFDLPAALAVADPALDMANPLKGPFKALALEWEEQARAALENLKKGLDAVGVTFADIVTANRYVTDLSDQDSLNRVWAEYFGDNKPTTTTVQVVQLATDPRCLLEINAVAIAD